MAIADLATIFQLSVNAGLVTMNGFGFRALSASPTWRQELVDEWSTTIPDLWYETLSQDVELFDLFCADIVPGTGLDVRPTVTPHASGDFVGGALPPNAPALLSWRSAQVGRSHRGRTYVYGLPLAALLGVDAFNVTWLDHLEAVVTEILGAWGPGGSSTVAEFGVISRQEDGAPVVPPQFTAVTEGRVVNQVASRRQRVHR